MRCSYCDSTVPDDSVLCPVCGSRLGVEGSAGAPPRNVTKIDEKGVSPGLLWYVTLSLLALTFLSVTAGLALLGIVDGLADRRQMLRQKGLEYYSRGLIHLEEGNYLLALAEFEEAVRLAPDCAEAQEQLALLRDVVGYERVPTSETGQGMLTTLYGEASVLCSEERWTEGIAKLEELRRLDPSYQPEEVEEMLFVAYNQVGLRLMEAGELEQALHRFESALELRPDDPTTSQRRLFLSLYLSGLTQWGVDWENVVESLQELYELNSDFLDVERRLHDAYLSLGDLYFEEGAWCVAESQYGAALEIMVTNAAVTKRDGARQLCVEAISAATPVATTTTAPAEPVTPTASATYSAIPEGYVGEFAGYADADPTAMRISVRVVDAQGQGVPEVEVRISAYGWQADGKVTDGYGYCEFAGLNQELEFMVTLTELTCEPVQVSTRWGKEALVNFVQR